MSTKLLFSEESWAISGRKKIAKHWQTRKKHGMTISKFKKTEWPAEYRGWIKDWYAIGCPKELSTKEATWKFKSTVYLKRKWNEDPPKIWEKFQKLPLPPKVKVNVWRWYWKALPLKERITWIHGNSIECDFCPGLSQTHKHLNEECFVTNEIRKKITKHIKSRSPVDLILKEKDSEEFESNLQSWWLKAWIISYAWCAIARSKLDSQISINDIIMSAPHVLRLDLHALKETRQKLLKM